EVLDLIVHRGGSTPVVCTPEQPGVLRQCAPGLVGVVAAGRPRGGFVDDAEQSGLPGVGEAGEAVTVRHVYYPHRWRHDGIHGARRDSASRRGARRGDESTAPPGPDIGIVVGQEPVRVARYRLADSQRVNGDDGSRLQLPKNWGLPGWGALPKVHAGRGLR